MSSTTITLVQILCASAVGTVTILRIPMITTASSRPLWLALALLTATQILEIQPVVQAVEDRLGPALAILLPRSLGLIAALTTTTVVGGLTGAKPQRRLASRAALVAALAVTLLPWLVDPPATLPARLTDDSWRTGVSYTGFLTFLGWTLVIVAVVCWRFRRREQPGSTRTSVSLIGLGAAAGLGFIAQKGSTIIALLAGHGQHLMSIDPVAGTLLLAGALLLIAGGCGHEAAWGHWARRRDARRLRVAWQQLLPHATWLRQAFPDVDTPPTGDDSTRAVAGVAAVHEALRRLTAYGPDPAASTSSARWLHEALDAKERGAPPTRAVTTAPIDDTASTEDSARYLVTLFAAAAALEEHRT